jgi:hypothetical protein
MKKLTFALLVTLGLAGFNVTNATVASSTFNETVQQDTTVKKDTTKTPTDTLKTKKPKQ